MGARRIRVPGAGRNAHHGGQHLPRDRGRRDRRPDADGQVGNMVVTILHRRSAAGDPLQRARPRTHRCTTSAAPAAAASVAWTSSSAAATTWSSCAASTSTLWPACRRSRATPAPRANGSASSTATKKDGVIRDEMTVLVEISNAPHRPDGLTEALERRLHSRSRPEGRRRAGRRGQLGCHDELGREGKARRLLDRRVQHEGRHDEMFDCHSHWSTRKGAIFRTEAEQADRAQIWGTEPPLRPRRRWRRHSGATTPA